MEDGVLRPTTTVGTPQGGVISPLLANIALNSLDWQLHDAGYRFVRYADDFVVLCQTEAQVKEAHELVQRHLDPTRPRAECGENQETRFRDGFAFLGFAISSWSVTMRPKSVEKFKTKIRELTSRKHNLDQRVDRESQRGGSWHGELLRHHVLQRPRLCFATWTAGCACESGA